MSDNSERTSRRRNSSPTLADVARIAEVSISTAGRVLRDAEWPVDPALRERVLAAAGQVSYVPNVMARTLRGSAPALVGLVVGNMLDPYYGEVAEAVTRHAEATTKMLVMVCNMQRDPLLELDYCRRFWEHRVAGLILAGGGFDQLKYRSELSDLLERMARSGVVITTLSPRDVGAASFCVDNLAVGRMAAAELAAHGHRRVGVLVGPVRSLVLQQRMDGIREVFDRERVKYHIMETELRPERIFAAAKALLDAHPDITGIVAVSSAVSVNAIRAVNAAGRSVPDDVSVIGIGGGALAEWATPQLTRIDLALDVSGRAALDFIAARVGGANPPEGLIHQPRLVPATSVAAAKRRKPSRRTSAEEA